VSKRTNKGRRKKPLPLGLGGCKNPATRRAHRPRARDRCFTELLEFEGGKPLPAAAWRHAAGACLPASSAPPSAAVDHGEDWIGESNSGASRAEEDYSENREKKTGLPLAQALTTAAAGANGKQLESGRCGDGCRAAEAVPGRRHSNTDPALR
jgi:hypothetical protein